MLRHAAAVFAGALPVTVGNFRDDFATLLDGLQYCSDVEMAIQSALHSDLYIVEINKYCDFEAV
jgi:hypothetical protein